MRPIISLMAGMLIVGTNATALTIDEAVEMALKSHPDGKIAQLRHESAQADTKSADASFYPRIDLNADYFPTKTFVMPANGSFSTRQSDAFHADISGNYPLWDFGRNKNRHLAASYQETAAIGGKQSRFDSLIEQVWTNYYTAAYLQHLIVTAEKSVRFYQEQYRKAARMREAGFKTEADESRFRASWMEAEENLNAARAEYDKTLMRLGLLIGGEENPSVQIEDFDRKADVLTLENLQTDSLRKELSLRNPQLQSLEASIHHAKSISDTAETEKYGSIALVGSYGYDNSLSSYDSSYVGVKGTVPLYDGGKITSETQKSRIALSIAQKEYESSERALWMELYSAHLDFERSSQTIAAKQSVIEATEKALRVMDERYVQGLSTYVDVLEAQSVLENARITLEGAKLQKIRAWAQIQRLLSRGCKNDVCKN